MNMEEVLNHVRKKLESIKERSIRERHKPERVENEMDEFKRKLRNKRMCQL